ncbi:sulfur oxidation c-type cytochrome SoxX [Sphaerotilus sp.]|uniref:sulfur oxidation c-type cytochrome SoxX n=1 Tax=Sphaerotilus sp. TaxID=2093942 RepID=UPI002ACECE64|nr:sulfur oxidation c-type cytochrome SoxX [Sphaerotilus sp.]MDZ7856277.1 sulfur oxidation c-type cytochrome SoxX [Sphaerotilus sp.]
MKPKNLLLSAGAVTLLVGCGSLGGSAGFPSAEQAVASSWQNMQPGWEKRLVQDDTQKICSAARDKPSKADAERVEKMNAAMKVVYPASGTLIGDWKRGEAIAQSGYGLRVGDNNPNQKPGGNCYACHQMTKQELSYGTLGPGLNQYGKLRGNSEAIVKYTYDKIYNSHAFSACSNMPRFGLNGILQPEQIADLVGLLMDPKSPVNQ